MKKLLLVIDMQNDFITGSLGTKEAQAIVPKVRNKIREYQENDGLIIFTKDTHYSNYLDTPEGKKLPVPHCIKGTWGHSLVSDIDSKNHSFVNKNNFGLGDKIEAIYHYISFFGVEEIELVGLCTDICVITNALDWKTRFPEFPISVDASCCAGTSVEAHNAAITVMKSCQINIINCT